MSAVTKVGGGLMGCGCMLMLAGVLVPVVIVLGAVLAGGR